MKFTIKTIGCKVNTYESMKIKDELVKLGFEYIDFAEKNSYKGLDFYIVNTCSVTKIADKKSRQMIHLAKKYNPNVKVVAIGCMVNSLFVGTKKVEASANKVGASLTSPAIKCDNTAIEGVDYLFPNSQKEELPKFLLSLSTEASDIKVDTIFQQQSIEADIISPQESVGASSMSPSRVRAFIKIQDGCNQYCTYCIIPYLRGNIKSRDNDEIIKEVKEKAENGVKEIVLTGIHLSSFGLDRLALQYENEGAIDVARKSLLEIMSQVSNIDGIERIRLGSLEPRIIDEYFLSKLVETSLLSKKFCANFCLSLQSGCDKTLKRMNRHYTTYDFENACKLIRRYIPYATITTDVIVGFPCETEEDFMESLEFVKRMRFYNPNIFPYSRRQGTKADQMDGQLTNSEKHKRVVQMIEDCDKISKEIEDEYHNLYPDRVKDVLIEEYIEKDGKKCGVGYTKEYIKVFV